MNQQPQHSLSSGLVALMAAACGLAVANIYYNQPLLGLMAREFGSGAQGIGAVPAATQIGYAFGLFLLGPLGDRFERRRVIVILCLLLALALLGNAAAGSLPVLVVTSFIVGLFATVVQQLVPMAAHLAPEARRGRVVGTVMSGLLLGILGGRFLAGMLGSWFGWHAVYAVSAGVMLLLAAALHYRLPRVPPAAHVGYPALLASVLDIARRHATLREAAVNGGLLFAAFSAFWVTLTPLLEGPAFGLGSRAAGLYGLLGAAGALIAPLAGRRADRSGSGRVLGLAVAVVFVSFLVFAASGHSLFGLGVGTVLMDLGIQAALIANQTRIYALEPAARSRINAFFMTAYFIGGALGSLAASFAWAHAGWTGAMGLGAALAAAAGLVHYVAPAPRLAVPQKA